MFTPRAKQALRRMLLRRQQRLSDTLESFANDSGLVATPEDVAAAGGTLAGDVTGDPTANTVEAIQGIAVSATDPSTDQVLTATSSSTAAWQTRYYRYMTYTLDGMGGFDFVVDLDGNPVTALADLE